MKGSAVIVRADRPREIIELDREATLEEVQGWVGGYVQMLEGRYDGQDAQFLIDEEGLLKGLPINHAATHLMLSQEEAPHMGPGITGTLVILLGEARWT